MKYGYRKESDGFHYGAFDNILSDKEFRELVAVLKRLPESQENKEPYEVYFSLGDLLVTEGVIDKTTGKSKLVGYNTSTNEWESRVVEFNTPRAINDLRYGDVTLLQDGSVAGMSKRIGGKR